MPCQHCSSLTHTLSGCDANIDPYLNLIKQYIAENPFKLRHQYQMINAHSRNVLAIINTRLGYRSSSVKILLVENIIKRYFLPRFGDIEFLPLGPDVKAAVAEGYGGLQMWNVDHHSSSVICNFRNEMYNLLNVYHLRMFGHSYAQALRDATATRLALFTQAVQVPIHPAHPAHLAHPAHPAHLAHPAHPAHLAHPAHPAHLAHNANKSHLKKLKIQITLDSELKVEDCFMCCDDKPIARLGCSHEYCVDCIVGSAKVRTKTFISCAVCRMEVREVQVSTAAIKKSFSEQIKCL